jgi:HlyD family secretion protein
MDSVPTQAGPIEPLPGPRPRAQLETVAAPPIRAAREGSSAVPRTAIHPEAAFGGSPPSPAWLRRHWRFLVAALGVFVILLVCGLFLALRAPAKTSAFHFEVVTVSRGPIEAKVTASGTVSPLVTVQVGSQISGRIQALGADFNSPVRKGQVVARIDPALFQAAVEQARARLRSARANRQLAEAQLANARLQAERNRSLRGERLVAQSVLDDSETALRVTQAQAQAAAAQETDALATLHQSEINLAYTTIASPIDGVVISRNVDVGQTVAASLQSPVLFLIAQDLRKMQVDTNVAEADVGRIAAGMAATFTVDAYASEAFRGRIREVRNAPQTLQNVVTYDAVVDVENPDLKLKPGMTANVTVVNAERSDALRVANAALRFRAPPSLVAGSGELPTLRANQRLVWVLRDGEAHPLAIRVGVSDGVVSEVLEGSLAPGDSVVTEAIAPAKSGPGSYGRVF